MIYGTIDSVRCGQLINLGDFIQLFAIERIYANLGVDLESIKKIPISELQTYRGEKMILPISFPFYGYNRDLSITCFSDDIVPIFLAVSFLSSTLSEKEIAYLKKNEPIGCRDEYTFHILNQYGIDAYLNGCMTLTISFSEDIKMMPVEEKKVYCIDVYDDVLDVMPEEIKKDVVRKTHMYDCTVDNAERFCEQVLREYKANAKLIVTSRLHCAVPCMALGIPVIFVSEKYSFRFSWLEKIITIYTPDMYNDIDWSPKEVDLREIRKLMMDNACVRILSADRLKDKSMKMEEIHAFYMQRNKRKYVSDSLWLSKRYIDRNWEKGKKIDYAVWGITQKSALLIEYIMENYPDAVLQDVIDKREGIFFYGKYSKAINKIDDIYSLFVFVQAEGAASYAIDYFNSIGKNESTYYIWLFDTNIL